MLVTESVITTGLTGPDKILEEIVLFAVARGWTRNTGGAVGLEAEKIGYIWDTSSPYGWNAGDGDFYTLSSTGYGSQNLICRLERKGGKVRFNMHSQTAYSLVATKPTNQNLILKSDAYTPSYENETYGSGWALPTGSVNALYLYGDATWIMAVVDYDGTFFTHMHFGSMNPIEAAPTQIETRGYMGYRYYDTTGIYGTAGYYVTSVPAYLNLSNVQYRSSLVNDYTLGGNAIYGYTLGIRYESEDKCYAAAQNDEIKYLYITGDHTYTAGTQSVLNNYRFLVRANAFSGKRPMFNQFYFYERNSDGVFIPFCTSPAFICNSSGLHGGTELDFGTETYRYFPLGDEIQATTGICLRTA